MAYTVIIERNGVPVPVGHISNSGFAYDDAYLHGEDARPISVSLPLREEIFSPQQTKCFFDGLLPEGFTRRTVAQWMHVSEDDYLSILAGLGKECLGAIQVICEPDDIPAHYQKLTLPQVQALAAEGATQSAKLVTESHLSLTGASGKVGLYYDAANNAWYQPFGTAPSTHIVKQSHVRLSGIVVNELLCLHTAKKCGIDAPDCFILDTGGVADENILFATARYDRPFNAESRMINGLPCPQRLHQEDFAQALGIPAAEKYEPTGGAYLKDAFALLKHRSANPLEDQLKLWDLTVFNFLIGNTDNHLKNLSLLYDASLASVRLAPAYDVISTTVYPGSTRDLSMRIGDAVTVDDVSESSFRMAAREVGIGEKLAIKRFFAMAQQFEAAITSTAEELTGKGFTNAAQLCEQILLTGGYRHIDK